MLKKTGGVQNIQIAKTTTPTKTSKIYSGVNRNANYQDRQSKEVKDVKKTERH